MRSWTYLSQILRVFLPTLSFKIKEFMVMAFAELVNQALGYKFFFMLNSAEHEILIAHQYKILRNSGFFRLR